MAAVAPPPSFCQAGHVPLSVVNQVNLALVSPVSNPDMDFRRQLALSFPTSLANAEGMPLPDIARVLLTSAWALA